MNQYFTNNDNIKSERRIIKYNYDSISLSFISDNGVFSKDRIDYGSRLLVDTYIKYNKDKKINNFLDVGCGYGPIGIIISRIAGVPVTMIDVNKRALHLAEMNIKENHVSSIEILESDCYRALENKKFQYILTNPPIHAGKSKVYEIVMEARHHLEEDGTLYIVIRKDQGAKSMINDLKTYYNVDVIARNKGFFIISCNLA